jgi:hypothetical protein
MRHAPLLPLQPLRFPPLEASGDVDQFVTYISFRRRACDRLCKALAWLRIVMCNLDTGLKNHQFCRQNIYEATSRQRGNTIPNCPLVQELCKLDLAGTLRACRTLTNIWQSKFKTLLAFVSAPEFAALTAMCCVLPEMCVGLSGSRSDVRW